MTTILVADDEPDVRRYLGVALGCDGYQVEFAENGNEVLERIRRGGSEVALILLDILMPYRDGLETLEELRRIRPNVPVIVLSGASSSANIVKAMRGGAVDFLPKPMSHEDLSGAVQKALPLAQGRPPLAKPRSHEPQTLGPVAGAWSQKLELLVSSIGTSDVPVLLQGETGVGKEVLARKLHARSARAAYPFLKLNCAALPSELVESELFGYERGAFTGAFKSTPGKFEMANQGCILLDEIGDMDFKLQAKLLQVVQDHEFLRLGAKEPSKVDVRVMAATHRNLEQAIVEGRFREDLYYRLNIIDIHIPPLRERRDEILPLAEFLIQTHATHDKPALDIPFTLRNALLNHDWPGNIRELENVMRKYLVLRNADIVADGLLHMTRKRTVAVGGATAPTNQVATGDRAGDILSVLRSVHWNQRKAAELLNMDSETLAQKLIALSISKPPHLGGALDEQSSSDPSILKNVDSAHKAAEVEAIVAALSAARWNRKQAAALLKIDYKALLYKIKKLGIRD